MIRPPYSKCLELIAATEPIITIGEAPVKNNWVNAIWEEPAKITNDITNVIKGEKPISVPITP